MAGRETLPVDMAIALFAGSGGGPMVPGGGFVPDFWPGVVVVLAGAAAALSVLVLAGRGLTGGAWITIPIRWAAPSAI